MFVFCLFQLIVYNTSIVQSANIERELRTDIINYIDTLKTMSETDAVGGRRPGNVNNIAINDELSAHIVAFLLNIHEYTFLADVCTLLDSRYFKVVYTCICKIIISI